MSIFLNCFGHENMNPATFSVGPQIRYVSNNPLQFSIQNDAFIPRGNMIK